MQIIGVLGGLGPQATMDFEKHLHRASQAHIPPSANGGYPPMVVYYCRFPPVLLEEDGRPTQPIQPEPRLLAAARALGRLADFLVIPANGPHSLRSELEEASGLEILDMVDLTLHELARRGWRTVGLLGLFEPRIYMEPVKVMGLHYHILPDAERENLDQAILRVMEGRESALDRATAAAAINSLREAGAEGVILGCTEIPLLLGEARGEEDLIDPIQLLAEAAVQRALA